jgi:hypothetical protein
MIPAAKVAELADALVLGASGPQPWGFESPLSHQKTLNEEFRISNEEFRNGAQFAPFLHS